MLLDYGFVMKLALMQSEFATLNIWPEAQPFWHPCEVKLKIWFASHPKQTFFTAIGLSIGHIETVLSGLAFTMSALTFNNWSEEFNMAYLYWGLDI